MTMRVRGRALGLFSFLGAVAVALINFLPPLRAFVDTAREQGGLAALSVDALTHPAVAIVLLVFGVGWTFFRRDDHDISFAAPTLPSSPIATAQSNPVVSQQFSPVINLNVSPPPAPTAGPNPAPAPAAPSTAYEAPEVEWLEWNEPSQVDDRPEYRSWVSAVFRFRSVRNERVQAFIEFENNRQVNAVISGDGFLGHEISALPPDKQYAVWVFLDLRAPTDLWVDTKTPELGPLGPKAAPTVRPGAYWTDLPFMQRSHRQRLAPGTYRARVRLLFGDRQHRSEHATAWREFVVASPAPATSPSRAHFTEAPKASVGAVTIVNVAQVSLAWSDTGTSLHVEVRNANPKGDAVRDFSLYVSDIRWFDPETSQAQEAHEVHGNGPFQRLQLLGGTTQIFANRPEVFPLFDVDCNYQGRTMDSPLEQKRLTTRGIWQVRFSAGPYTMIRSGDTLYLEWLAGQPPKPWRPPTKSVTSAPEPPRTLGHRPPPRVDLEP